MIELVLKNYLVSKLVSPLVPVCFEVPDDGGSFVLIEKTGGGGDSKVFTATVAVQSYAETLYQAAELNERIKEYMESFADEISTVSECVLNSDYNFTDTETKRYRYQAVYNIVHF